MLVTRGESTLGSRGASVGHSVGHCDPAFHVFKIGHLIAEFQHYHGISECGDGAAVIPIRRSRPGHGMVPTMIPAGREADLSHQARATSVIRP